MTDSTGAHDGYGGNPGTYLMQDGLRIAVDPQTLEPLAPLTPPVPVPAIVPVAEKINLPEPAKKTVSDIKPTE